MQSITIETLSEQEKTTKTGQLTDDELLRLKRSIGARHSSNETIKKLVIEALATRLAGATMKTLLGIIARKQNRFEKIEIYGAVHQLKHDGKIIRYKAKKCLQEQGFIDVWVYRLSQTPEEGIA
ncbi:hypothetical protein [Methanocella sp. MCL-LM]|uniref:hypothetical protein n=1 Tax=Methanocella sp. MCL-LM TaxID=3412035 RepID=UPI003C76FB0F